MKVIKFSATWCHPCKIYAPIFDKISNLEQFKDIEFEKIDIDNEDISDLVNNYNIHSIPTTIIEDNGQIIARKSGYMYEGELINFISEHKQ